MQLIYPVNFVGHEEWMASGYALDQAAGEVVTRDGEVLGNWRVVDYNPDAAPDKDDEGGRYEFIESGQDVVKFFEEFSYLDYRVSRGFALSEVTRRIKEWHESKSM